MHTMIRVLSVFALSLCLGACASEPEEDDQPKSDDTEKVEAPEDNVIDEGVKPLVETVEWVV